MTDFLPLAVDVAHGGDTIGADCEIGLRLWIAADDATDVDVAEDFFSFSAVGAVIEALIITQQQSARRIGRPRPTISFRNSP